MARATRGSTRIATSASLKDVRDEPEQLSSPPPSPPPLSKPCKTGKRKAIAEEYASPDKLPVIPKSIKRAKKVKKEEGIDDMPHNLGAVHDPPLKSEPENGTPVKRTKKATEQNGTAMPKKEDVDDLVEKATTTNKKIHKKKASYGLTPGQTPYPNYPHPTAEECEEVTRILSKVHGTVTMPKSIPTPSLEVSGCGEVPSVLDALIRTRLSAATSGANSSRAFAGLVKRFGVLQSGIGKGSVDWNAVRQADVKDIFEAIKSGGLADVKSKDIKKILEMVWEENQARRDVLKSSQSTVVGEQNGTTEEKSAEVQKADAEIVSLDHLHLLSNDDAFAHLTSYPGIGPKTASCVLLFCLQRPSFAVDTHVFRLCKWLNWVPPPGDERGLAPGAKGTFAGPTRNSTYAHCEVRVPDHLKYPLHQLLIKHGKSCPRCRAITGESSEGWEKGCPIDHLVQRSGGRKGDCVSPVKTNGKAVSAKKMKPRAKGRKKVESEDESDAEASELSDVESSALSDLVSDAEIEASESEASESEASALE